MLRGLSLIMATWMLLIVALPVAIGLFALIYWLLGRVSDDSSE